MNKLINIRLRKAANLLQSQRFFEARKICTEILAKHPHNTDALSILASICMRDGNQDSAIVLLKSAIKLQPQQATYHFSLGLALICSGALAEAITHLRTAININPNFSDAHIRLCSTAGQLGRFDEAIKAGKHAVRLDPNSYVAHTNLAAAYEASCDGELAVRHYKKAVHLAPNNAVIQESLGNALVAIGDKQSADECYRHATRIQPKHTSPYIQIAQLHRYSSTDHPDFKKIQSLLLNESIPEFGRAHLHFALGKMFDNCGCYDVAFEHFNQGNRIVDKYAIFDPETFIDTLSRIKEFYTPELLHNMSGMGNPSQLPIFIVGMPRSGTTLIEQLIASHPDAFGAGEVTWFGTIEQRVIRASGSTSQYPECVKSLDIDSVHTLTNKYIQHIKMLAKNVDYLRITDKLPGNFIHIGLINLLFPNAIIINCQRNPLDTCLSIYSNYFPNNVPFGYSLENLGIVYSQYQSLMRHWETVMPNRVINISYEALANNPETEIKRIIEFTGLPWNSTCLEFHNNKRTIRTVTAFQIRQPIYSSAIGRWNHYKRYLSQLTDMLRQVSTT